MKIASRFARIDRLSGRGGGSISLGYPKAALFSFAPAVLAWNTYAVVKAARRVNALVHRT